MKLTSWWRLCHDALTLRHDIAIAAVSKSHRKQDIQSPLEQKNRMKQEFLGCVLMALAAGSAGAQTISTVTASDGTTGASSTYSAQGFVIDFNANNGSSAAWSPVLVGGDQYALDSISVQLGSTDASTTPEYLGVYSGTPSSSTYLGGIGECDQLLDRHGRYLAAIFI
jgi:hypothetical protein